VRVRNLAISEAVAPLGLYYAPDPSSQIACTIGGNVAENSGGVHCLKYGLTVHNVLKVRGYTVEGDPVEFGGDAYDAPGLDLLAVLVGSEGMLAVVTEVTVKLTPKPQLARCIMASFPTCTGRRRGGRHHRRGIIPAGLEMMDKPMTAAVEDFVHAGYDLDAAAILLCESDGTPEEVEEEIGRMKAVLASAGATAWRSARTRPSACVLERAQERLPGLGAHQPRLHVHGLDHPAQAPGRHPAGHPGDGEEVPAALLQRLPRRRRQPAPADPVRCQRPGPAAPLRALRRRHPGDQRGHGRHGHRRARRGRGKAQLHVRAVQPRGAGPDVRPQGRLRPGRPAQPRQGAAHAAPLRRIRPHACEEGPAALPELERF
jgi:hypothetical protein